MNLPPNLLSAFVTVFVTIGPIETAVVFAALTAGVHRPERKSLAAQSVTIAGVVLLLFALGGAAVLSLLRVSLPGLSGGGRRAPIPAGTDPDLLKSRPVVHQRERNTRCARRRRHRDISAGVSGDCGP